MAVKKQTGYVHLYTGCGKGKTTAALGLAVRAAGANLRVLFVQFAKGQFCSEHRALRILSDSITVRRFGSPSFIGPNLKVTDKTAAEKGFRFVTKALQRAEYDVIILDEIAYAVSSGLLPAAMVVAVIQERNKNIEVVMTGRNAPKSLRNIADLVTEMKEIKHYWDQGIRARKGIEL